MPLSPSGVYCWSRVGGRGQGREGGFHYRALFPRAPVALQETSLQTNQTKSEQRHSAAAALRPWEWAWAGVRANKKERANTQLHPALRVTPGLRGRGNEVGARALSLCPYPQQKGDKPPGKCEVSRQSTLWVA
jgi:hypothetical protein